MSIHLRNCNLNFIYLKLARFYRPLSHILASCQGDSLSIKWEITRREQQVKTGNVPRASGAMKSRSSTSVRDVDLRLRRQKLLHAFRVSIQGTHVYWHHSAVATSLFNNENGKVCCKKETIFLKQDNNPSFPSIVHPFIIVS